MKKVLFSVIAVVALAGCASYYDYYKGGVRYTQDGEDCIYYAGQQGRHYSSDIRDIDSTKKVVYRNTRCSDLFAADNFGTAPRPSRQVLAPAAKTVAAPACGCKTCGVQPVSRRYYIVSGM